MKRTWMLDLEVYPEFFFAGIKDYREQNYLSFEVSKYNDQRKEFYKVISNFDGFLVTFNGVSYDSTIIAFFVKNFKRLKSLSVKEFCKVMKDFSNNVIDDNFELIKTYRWWKKPWTEIDLYLYWSKMLRISKQLSLKALAVQLNWDEIQELPYEHTTILTKEQIEVVKRYNLRNDLGILEKLFEKMKEDMVLRHYIQGEYDLPCWSMDAPKIASELIVKDYCQKTIERTSYQDLDSYIKDFKAKRFQPYYGSIKDIMGGFNIEFELPIFQKLKEDIYNSTRSLSLEFPLNYKDTNLLLSYGIGGLHTIQENQIFESTEEILIITSDYASLYPNIIINWNCIRFKEVLEKYISVKTDRISAKKEGAKKKDTVLKLILNALSGMLDNENSPLYYPEGALRMRIIGQLILTKTMELCLLNDFRVISLNTDGLEVMVPRSRLEEYKTILSEAEKLFNIALEHDVYRKIVYSNVNNYLALTEKGKAKRKGAYFKLTRDEKGESEIPLGDSVNENIICRALSAYFIQGIDVAEYICNPQKYGNHIYDYCKSNKISKQYEVYHNGVKVQNLNRYYFARTSPYLLKKKKGKNTFDHVNVGQGVILFNKFEEKNWEDYKIDYSYYCSKARRIIDQVTVTERQGSLF